MAELIALVTEVFGFNLATIGGTAITLGLVTAGALVFALGVSVFKRVKGR